MPDNAGRTRARLAVSAYLAHHGWSTTRLATESTADPGTIGDFLGGKRWIKHPTQGKIERALGWPAGTIATIEAGGEAPPLEDDDSVGGGTEDDPNIGSIKARKPANMSDEDFKRMLEQFHDEIEFRLNRAAGERPQ